jgi:hypothetical protein
VPDEDEDDEVPAFAPSEEVDEEDESVDEDDESDEPEDDFSLAFSRLRFFVP